MPASATSHGVTGKRPWRKVKVQVAPVKFWGDTLPMSGLGWRACWWLAVGSGCQRCSSAASSWGCRLWSRTPSLCLFGLLADGLAGERGACCSEVVEH